ncbi:hypothetical protein L9F63_017292 [Diploptera punctata]|uniref:P21-activated protein kinase-interacting protein 1-like n=1 Tax=Diploptera punctata TaxID=6984 RepID=A0AAD7ZZA7_DIPPU|nr:hypothetical protein L9F63_017292 [Diploptera punctata]
MPASDLEIIVGTYEEFLLGYKVLKKENDKFHLVQSFADHSHRASIRSVCAKGKYLASGSADESITLYDMKNRKECGILVQHNGMVNCMLFSPNGSHLLSGSEDGSIAIFRTGSWQLEKLFPKAHKGEVHPTGKLALTVGTDATLRTWNLVKGRQAYATNLGKNRTGNGRAVTNILWSPDGNSYVLTIGAELNVYDVATAGIVYTIKLDKKISSVCFTKDTELAIGDEGGGISFYSVSEKKQLFVVEAHNNSRVKCLSCVTVGGKKFLVSTSSAGEIKLWKCKVGKLKQICSTNSDCRITCLVVLVANSDESTLNTEIKEEITEINNTSNEVKSDKSKRKRRNSEENPDVKKLKTTQDIENKGIKSSKKSVSEVVCTRGQKWVVEDL